MTIRWIKHTAIVSLTATSLAWTASATAQKPAEEELKALQVPDGMEVSLFAAEPMLTNPAAIDVDTHGRVWVAELEWYRSAAKQPGVDKIRVLEDTDGDGRADKSTVFADDVFTPMSICVAGDKVFVATSPDLWVYEDKDGDLHADGPPRKVLTGFGGYNRDHGAHSLALGPDHKWWMAHGDYGFKVTGTDGSQIESKWGAVARGELDGSQLEVVATNFRNPYEVCVTSFGESYLCDNDNDGNFSVRFCWIMEGGDYGWFGRPPGKRGSVPESIPFSEHWHFRGHIPGYVPATVVTGFGAPSGNCFYEGDAFGPGLHNVALLADPGPREIRAFRHETAGAGMRGTSELILSTEGDDYFRPDDVCAAPDGSLYVADWYDGAVGGHAYNNPLQGRIFRITPKKGLPARAGKAGPYANIDDAIEGLKSPNLATQFLAREKLLAEGSKAVPALTKLLAATDSNFRARALWVLDRIGGAAREPVVACLANADASMRALGVRILRRHDAEYADHILPLADDQNAEVRREVLLALPKIEGAQAEAALAKLAAAYDGKDRYLLEAINIAAKDGNHKAKLYETLTRSGDLTTEKIQLYQVLNPAAASQFIAKQIAASKDDAERARLLQYLGGSPDSESFPLLVNMLARQDVGEALRRQTLEQLKTQLEAHTKFADDAALQATLRKLLAEPAWQLVALDMIGDGNVKGFGDEVFAFVTKADASQEVRTRAMEIATQMRLPGTVEIYRKYLQSDDVALRKLALEGLIKMQDWATLQKLLTDKTTPEALKKQVISRMVASGTGAIVLLRRLDGQELEPALTQQIIAAVAKHPDSSIRLLFEKYIPEDQRPKRLGDAIDSATILALKGNPERGLEIFQGQSAQCKNCHLINGFGRDFGPDLTQIGKKYERGALLDTILNPSKAIAPEFIPYVVETDEGLIYAGFLVEKNDRKVAIKDINNKLIQVSSEHVVTFEPQQKSLMPELVLRDVTAQDAADLLAYLTSLKETLPKLNPPGR